MNETKWAATVVWALIALLVVLFGIVLWLAFNRASCIEQTQALRTELDAAQKPSDSGGAERPIPARAAEPQWRFPLADSDYLALTSPFGYRVSPLLGVEMYHDGLDIAGVWRAQVVSIADGVVREHWPPPDGYWRGHPIYGGMVVIEHDDGTAALYAHLSWTRVHTGDRVTAGEVLGRIGETGKADGPHLHFEIHAPDDSLLNPLLYVRVPEEEQ